ncbi:MAG TPA: abortive infection family protein [Candidatus Acidoferrales bacterium]|nr:abortive infection family protein [Candidatus Acidoferrales bacterium]
MKVSAKSAKVVRDVITGDSKLSPYRSGQDLVQLFRRFGFQDEYGQGFPSRWKYVEERIAKLNGTQELDNLLTSVLDPVEFVEDQQRQASIIEKLNEYLAFDGYQILIKGKKCKITNLIDPVVQVENKCQLTDDFVHEQFSKLDEKLKTDDFDGAITNSRSLIEGVIAELHQRLTGDSLEKSGDLRQDFKAVRGLMNLSPDAHSDETIRQILQGLNSIVSGIDSLSNQMGDRHMRRHKPQKRHAKLAVNAAKTAVDFLLDTYLSRT